MFRLHFSFWVWSIALGILVLLSIAMVLIGAVAYFAEHSKPIHAYRFLMPYGLFFLCMLASYLYIIHSWKRQQCLFFCVTTFVSTYDIFNYEKFLGKIINNSFFNFFDNFHHIIPDTYERRLNAMKKKYSLRDMISAGTFLLMLLTFIFTFAK